MLWLDLSLNQEETTLVLIKYFSPVCPSRIYDLRHSQSWNQSFLWVLEQHTVDNVENIIAAFRARQENLLRNKSAETGVRGSDYISRMASFRSKICKLSHIYKNLKSHCIFQAPP